MPSVIIPPPYRGPTRGKAEITVAADTLRGCIMAVEEQHPGFGELVFAPNGTVHRYVTLFLNGEVVDPADIDRAVVEDDAVEVLAAIAGG